MISKIRNLSCRLAEEEGVSDPKDTGESVKTETERWKWVNKNQPSILDPWYDSQCFNTQIIRVQEERRKE